MLQYKTKAGYGKKYKAPIESLSERGKLTGTICKVFDRSNTMLRETLFYDVNGNLIQSKAENHMGGYDMEYYAYSFTGQPLMECHKHILKDSVTTDVFSYTYDAEDRLIQTSFSQNGGDPVTLSQFTYDGLGRIDSKVLPGTAGNIRYGYNIHNNPVSINSGYFKQTLYYDSKSDNQPGYLNGNISAIAYSSTYHNDGTYSKAPYAYDFEYDEIDRLRAATMTTDFRHDHSTTYKYDRNGNMLNLRRYGVTDYIDDEYEYGIVDDLSFEYNHNKLVAADDSGNETYVVGSTDFNEENTAARNILMMPMVI